MGPADVSGARTRIGLLLVAAVVLVSCGGDSGDSGGGGPGTTAGSVEADRQRAQRVVLAAGDVPGFRVERSRHSSNAPTGDAFARCNGGPPAVTDPANPRGVRGEDYVSRNSRLRATSFAVLFASAPEAVEAMGAVRRIVEGTCLEGALRTGFAAAFEGSDVAVRPFDLPGPTDEILTRRVTFALTVDREKNPAHLDFVYLRQGRAVAGLVASGSAHAFPTADRVRLTELLGARLKVETGSPGVAVPAGPITTTTLRIDQFERAPNLLGMSLARARTVALDAGFVLVKANDGAGKGRTPAFDDASWTVRYQSPNAGSPLPHLADIILILEVVRPGERYTPTSSPCPPFVQC